MWKHVMFILLHAPRHPLRNLTAKCLEPLWLMMTVASVIQLWSSLAVALETPPQSPKWIPLVSLTLIPVRLTWGDSQRGLMVGKRLQLLEQGGQVGQDRLFRLKSCTSGWWMATLPRWARHTWTYSARMTFSCLGCASDVALCLKSSATMFPNNCRVGWGQFPQIPRFFVSSHMPALHSYIDGIRHDLFGNYLSYCLDQYAAFGKGSATAELCSPLHWHMWRSAISEDCFIPIFVAFPTPATILLQPIHLQYTQGHTYTI